MGRAGGWGIWKVSIPSFQSCCKPKLVLKNTVFLKKKVQLCFMYILNKTLNYIFKILKNIVH
jgi:hypothetical protein